MLALTQRIHRMYEVHKIAGVNDAAVRTEIAGTVLDHLAGKKHLRELILAHAYPWIGLGILQKDIIARLELLDEIILKQQGICLGVNDRILRVSDLRHHHGSLARKPIRRYEILRHPLMQVLCLTHINHIPLSVIIPVYARGMWK